MQMMHIALFSYVKVPVAYISSLVLIFLTFCISGLCYHFLSFLKVNYGFFRHNRVATLL